MAPLIILKNVGKEYSVKKKVLWKLENINFEIDSGDIVTIIGPSGCGKTTLLKLIANILEPNTGVILYKGISIDKARRSRLLGYVPQTPTLLPHRTLKSNVLLPLEILSVSGDKNQIAQNIINLVGLNGFEDFYPFRLSGGMQQRVSLARGLVYNPEVLLLDEPFASLDEILREKMDLELIKIHDILGRTTIFVTHNIEEAVFISDKVIIMGQKTQGVIDKITIDLPKERTRELKNSQLFFEMTKKVRQIMQKTC